MSYLNKNTLHTFFGILFSTLLFSQKNLDSTTTYYRDIYYCAGDSFERENPAKIKCKISRELKLSYTKDSLFYINNDFTYGYQREVYAIVNTTKINANTNLYFLKDSLKKNYAFIICKNETKLTVSAYAKNIDSLRYVAIVSKASKIENKEKLNYLKKELDIYLLDFNTKKNYEAYRNLSKLTYKNYKGLASEIQNLPKQEITTSNSKKKIVIPTQELHSFFIKKGLDPIYASSFYGAIKRVEKERDRIKPKDIFKQITNILYMLAIIALLYVAFRSYRFFKYKNKTSISIPNLPNYHKVLSVFMIIGISIICAALGGISGYKLAGALGYTGGSSIIKIFYAAVGIPVGAVIGVLISTLFLKKPV